MKQKNKITAQLLAAYAEGKVSKAERDAVRQYLAEHPEQMETVMLMMDQDSELGLVKGGKNGDKTTLSDAFGSLVKATSGGVMLNSAAFAPCILPKTIKTSKSPKVVKSGFKHRLDDFLDEIDS